MMATMKLRHEIRYDAPATDVLAMLHDATFWDRVAEATGARDNSTTVSEEGGRTKVVVDQQQDVVGVPAFAKKIVGDTTRAVKTQVWNGSTGSFVVETPGKPTHISGQATVTDAGTGSVLVYDLEVKASVPLVAGKLEKLVGELTAEGFDKEAAVGAAWLRGDR